VTALAFGPDELPEVGGVPTRSTRLPVTNIGVFRQEEPQPFYCLFRCGRYNSGHDHPDRLSVYLNAFGETVTSDLGTPGYSLHPSNGYYYRSTLSHNTMFVDEGDTKGDASLVWQPDASDARYNLAQYG